MLAALTGAVPDLAGPVVGGPATPRPSPRWASPGSVRPVSDALAGLRRPPSWWHALYAALAATPAVVAAREELAALPVRLADGRRAGPRGTLLPDAGLADVLAGDVLPGLRLVDPAAVDPLLETLGARRADAASLLDEPDCARRWPGPSTTPSRLDVEGLAALVLRLLADGGAGTADPAWGALALPDAEGGCRRADELVLPDGALRTVLGDDSPSGCRRGRRGGHARSALLAAGVLDGFAVVRDDAPAGPDHDLDDEEAWWAEEVDPAAGWDGGAPAGPPGTVVAVRDLDLVADGRWDAAWALLAADRSVHSPSSRCRASRCRTRRGGSPATAAYARHAPGHWRLPGEVPGPRTVAGADPGRDAALAALSDPVPGPAGCSTPGSSPPPWSAPTCDRRRGRRDRPARPARRPGADGAGRGVLAAHSVLAAAVDARRIAVADVEPPPRVRTAGGRVVDAVPHRGAVPAVLDRPWLLAGLDADAVVPVASDGAVGLADLLDLPLVGTGHHGEVRSPGVATRWTDLPAAAAWASAVDGPAGERGRRARAPAGRRRRRRPEPPAARGLPRGLG